MVLVDTSAWIEFLRDTGSPVCVRVDSLLVGDDVAICDPVRMEVLAGARDERHLGDLRRLLARASSVSTVSTDYEDAATYYRTCRRAGATVRSVVDCLIAAVAVRAGIPVLHADRDYDVLALLTALETASGEQ